jgi:heme O synthase-like polyprenyltransferase
MARTSQRPLVLGMNPNVALISGISLGSLGLFGLYCYNPLTAILGGTIWASYLFIYTKMKSQS